MRHVGVNRIQGLGETNESDEKMGFMFGFWMSFGV